MKKIRLLLALIVASIGAVQSAWAQDEEQTEELTVSVSLLEPGSLGTEILSAPGVEHIKDVVNLTVSGPMNDEDWSTLKLTTSLKNLDLSAAQVTSLPGDEFRDLNSLTTVKLPETLTTIGGWAFSGCTNLETINWPASVEVIDRYCFNGCQKVNFTIPEGVTTIYDNVFKGCTSFASKIPSTIKYIGGEAFRDCSMEDIDIVIPEGAYVEYHAFRGTKPRSITFPSNIYAPNTIGSLQSDDLTITFKSPTMVSPYEPGWEYSQYSLLNDEHDSWSTESALNFIASSLTLRVPSHLVNSYKLNPVWGKCKAVEGFSINDVTDVDTWPIQTEFNMPNSIRLEGTPNVGLTEKAVLKISGTAQQNFGDFSFKTTEYWNSYPSPTDYNASLFLSTCDNVKVTGNMEHSIQTDKQKWYFLTMPFDFKVGDITTEDDVKFAIRYYDATNRAANNTSTGNWKNYDKETIVKAGEGFILQTSQVTWITFKALNNDSRSQALSNLEIIVPLLANTSSEIEHKGWNLVGNPWQTYYNIHKMNFTAPISTYGNGNYVAYSVIDDDYALKPNEAFFVQCPDEVNSIGFPTDGRQLTDVIESQNAARATAPSERKLIDVVLSYGEMSDKTRFVMNPSASMDYELTRDASKFFSMDSDVPQIYTIENGTQMAINERPLGDGTVKLGLRLAQDGQYTITAPRNGFKNIVLVDNETGMETDLCNSDGYTFSADKGTCENRFMLRVGGTVVTEISEEVRVKSEESATATCYDLQGRQIVNSKSVNSKLQRGLYIVNGKKVLK